jgi:hypothetical protein
VEICDGQQLLCTELPQTPATNLGQSVRPSRELARS